MAASSQVERGLHGAIVAGWIEDQAPQAVQFVLFDRLDHCRVDLDAPPALLWHSIAETLRDQGCFDAELACWSTLLTLSPGEPAVLCRLAETQHRRGEDAAARALLAPILPRHPSRAAALGLLMELDGASTAEIAAWGDELATALLARPAWEPAHHRLVRRWVAAGLTEPAQAFLTAWTTRHPETDSAMLLELGWLSRHAGDTGAARNLFRQLWARRDPEIEAVAGRFDGTVPAYTPGIEQAIQERINNAFAVPEGDLARIDLTDDPAPRLKDTKILFAGFERMTLPNDLAEHFRRSAQAAGLEIDLYLDSAIVFSHAFRGGDETVRRRVEAFETALATRRPDMVILDCAYPPTRRGLRPDRMAELARELGFHLVCVMRDALDSNLPYLLAWAEAARTVLVFDSRTALLRPEHAAHHSKVLVALPPAQHLEPGRAERDLGMVFIGADAYGVRNMLLSVLLNEDIAFTAITGDRRAVETPDMDAYAGILRRARAVLNVAAHSRTEFLVTGRVFEAIACGALLIEQDNPATAAFFTPWRHYLPWTNVDDIVQLGRFVERNPATAARIAAEARGWLDRHYTCKRFWSTLSGRHQIP